MDSMYLHCEPLVFGPAFYPELVSFISNPKMFGKKSMGKYTAIDKSPGSVCLYVKFSSSNLLNP